MLGEIKSIAVDAGLAVTDVVLALGAVLVVALHAFVGVVAVLHEVARFAFRAVG